MTHIMLCLMGMKRVIIHKMIKSVFLRFVILMVSTTENNTDKENFIVINSLSSNFRPTLLFYYYVFVSFPWEIILILIVSSLIHSLYA